MMSLFEKLLAREEKLSLVGLGYVGLPIAVSFSEHLDVIGFDVNLEKVEQYRRGVDPTREAGDEAVKNCAVDFTADETRLREAKFHIVAVPTPVRKDKTPDLSLVESASRLVGRNLTPGSIVVYESTVYPGVTEEICLPILERESGLQSPADFRVAYSPERINPGDKTHRLENIVKIVSGQDAETLDTVARVYSLVVKAGVHKAASIKIAEAAKVIENAQRDINIAFMNELSLIFNKMGIDTKSVLEAASTKWNFLRFYPGLVGGHCIGVDPYYLASAAETVGIHPDMILSGRRTNSGMGEFVARKTAKLLHQAGHQVAGARVAILGMTFKENIPDYRNSQAPQIISELREYGVQCFAHDPMVDEASFRRSKGIELVGDGDLAELDGIVLAVPHRAYIELGAAGLGRILRRPGVLVDVTSALKSEDIPEGIRYWSL